MTFPHHENEIAQSEAMTGKTFAKYWMHNGYINIDNEKMSKSLGNFVLTKDLIAQHKPQVLRFFMLSVHYRHPINFTEELLESAKNSLDRIQTAYHNLEHRKSASLNLTEDNAEWLEKIADFKRDFEKEMDDDFNTANAISVLFELSKEANIYLNEPQTKLAVIEAFQDAIMELLGILGINLNTDKELLDEEIETLITERNEARKNRDFAKADEIRDLLKEKSIILEDTAQGVRWKRG